MKRTIRVIFWAFLMTATFVAGFWTATCHATPADEPVAVSTAAYHVNPPAPPPSRARVIIAKIIRGIAYFFMGLSGRMPVTLG